MCVDSSILFLFAFNSKCSSMNVVAFFENFYENFLNNICLFMEFLKLLLYRQGFLISIHYLKGILIFVDNSRKVLRQGWRVFMANLRYDFG